LYRNKYRIESTRLKHWDYSSNDYYFVTTCTKNQECYFGTIENNEMILSEVGKIAAEEWKKTGSIREHIRLDEWIIMPNHIHGILIIDNPPNAPLPGSTARGRDALHASLAPNPHNKTHTLGGKNNLSHIIRGFKSACTKRIKEAGLYLHWQPRFHDRIIRNGRELNNIRQYIINNPAKWDSDRENPVRHAEIGAFQ